MLPSFFVFVLSIFFWRNLSAMRMSHGGTNEPRFGLEAGSIIASFHYSFPMSLTSSVFLLVLNGREVRKVRILRASITSNVVI